MNRWLYSRTYTLVISVLAATFCLDWFKGTDHWPGVVTVCIGAIVGRMAREGFLKRNSHNESG